jgi:hypothetical protein
MGEDSGSIKSSVSTCMALVQRRRRYQPTGRLAVYPYATATPASVPAGVSKHTTSRSASSRLVTRRICRRAPSPPLRRSQSPRASGGGSSQSERGDAYTDPRASRAVGSRNNLGSSFIHRPTRCATVNLARMLEQLGFTADEIIPCEIHDGLVVVPARVDGEDVGLVLTTARTSALTITREYAARRGWRLEDPQRVPSGATGYAHSEIHFAMVPSYSILGAEERFDRVPVDGEERYRAITASNSRVVGTVGRSVLGDRVLAVDYQRSAIAVSQPWATWHARPRDLAPAYQFPMTGVPGRWHPLIDGMRFFEMPLKLYLDSGTWSSALSADVYRTAVKELGILSSFIRWRVRRRLRGRKPVPLFLKLPDGVDERIWVYLMGSLRPWSDWIGVDRIDGWLGGHFLSSWLTVLDFEIGSVSLFARSP